MLHIKRREKNQEILPALFSEDGEMQVIPLILDCIDEVSQIKLSLPSNLTQEENKLQIKKTMIEI